MPGLTESFRNLVPGQTAVVTSDEVGLLLGKEWNGFLSKVWLVSTAVDARSTTTTDLQAGLVLGKITSTGKYRESTAALTTGAQVARCILAEPVQMLDRTGTVKDQFAKVYIGGAFKIADIGGLTAFARANLAPYCMFDDEYDSDNTYNAPNRFGWTDVVAKTADYTIVASDNCTIFTNQGDGDAIVFTLPALAKGLKFRFFIEAAQDFTVQCAGSADVLVVFNDATADSLAWTTSGEKIGGWCEVIANADGTKWMVFEGGHDTMTSTVA